MFTQARVLAFAPSANPTSMALLAENLQDHSAEYAMDTPLRAAMFMGQCYVESWGFTRLTENLNYSPDGIKALWPRLAARAITLAHNPEALANAAYAEYTDASGKVHDPLGNGLEGNGNGWRYRGRGLTQITGHYNYDSVGAALGMDLVDNPDLVGDWSACVPIALRFWQYRHILEAADTGSVEAVTKLVTGSETGLQQRKDATDRARKVFV